MRLFSTRLLVFFVVVTFGVAFVGCDSGGSNGGNGDTLDPEKAKSEVSNTDSDLSTNFSELTTGPFATTALGLFSSSSSTASAEKKAETPLGFVLLDQLDQQGISQTSTGEYSWDGQTWELVDGSADDLILNFRTSPNASTNDATFTLSEYNETQVTLDGGQEMVPTTVDASMTVEGSGEIFSVNLSNTSFYSEQVDGSQVPQSFSLEVLTAPQFHTFQLNSPSKSEFEFEFDLEKEGGDGEKVLGLLVGATLNNDFDAISGAGGIDELSGNVELGPSVTLDYTVDVDGIDGLGEDPSVDAVNDQFTATLNVNDQKAGDIEFAEISQGNETVRSPVIVYPNGDQEPLQQAFGSTFATILGSPAGDFSSTAKSAATSIKDAVVQLF